MVVNLGHLALVEAQRQTQAMIVMCCLICETEWRLATDGKNCWSCDEPGISGGLSQNRHLL